MPELLLRGKVHDLPLTFVEIKPPIHPVEEAKDLENINRVATIWAGAVLLCLLTSVIRHE